MAPTAEEAACTRCGTFYKNNADVYYSEKGDKVCQKCFEVGDLDATAQRYARTMRNGAYLAPLVAAAAVISSMFIGILGMLLMGASVLASGGLLLAVVRDEELRKNLGRHLIPACLFAGLGLLVSGGCLALVLLGMGFALTR